MRKDFKFFLLFFHRILFLLFIIKIFQLVEIVESREISCESVKDASYGWGSSSHTLKSCYIDKTTSIDRPDTEISARDESVTGFWSIGNGKILFLPIDIDLKFPNLQGYGAERCSIKEISKRNFKGLHKLKGLYLHSNQITKISSDTFSDLKVLEYLGLSEEF